MKIFKVALLCAPLLLMGCSTIQDAVDWATTTTTTPAEANSVAAAGNLYVAAAKAADSFVKTNACTKAMRDEIATLSADARKDLDDALTAEKAGDSAKVQLALDAFNQAYPAFFSYLTSHGVNP